MRKYLLTGETFISTRINQKFVRPENRIVYYNNKANALRHKKAFVNKALHQNLKILEELLAEENDIKAHKQFLLGMGFNFGVHTHIMEYSGKDQYAVYNFVIIPLLNDQLQIIKL
jgi:ABC-type uncharacterized transport system substrate-binding protein